MEVKQKKSRAPKVTSTQLEFLIGYMEKHNAFATGKLLGARGKATHDAQWEELTKELNRLEGPSKNVEAWKKLWCDQRNQARGRAAKAKADQNLTGNVGNIIQLKDLDLRILSIIGAESSIGLPIMEMGFGQRPEDTADPSQTLGLVANTDSNEINNILQEEYEIRRLEESTSITIEDREETNIFSDPQDNFLPQDNNEEMSTHYTIIPISTSPIDKCLNQHAVTNETDKTNKTDKTTASHSNTGQSLITSNNPTNRNRKRFRSSSMDEAVNSFKYIQEKHAESLQAITTILSRIASAIVEQNEVLRRSSMLQERTLETLCTAIKYLNRK